MDFGPLPDWFDRVFWAAVVAAVGFALARLLNVLAHRLASGSPSDTADLVRLRRRETAFALLATIIRYVFFVAAAGILVTILVRDRVSAAAGATLIILIIAFSAQRLLSDIIAGFFILFENQFGVGDFIEVEPSKYSGVVEAVGLRTTVMRDLNGDTYFIPNGQIIAVKRSRRRYRTFIVELLTRDRDHARDVVRQISGLAPIGGARFLRPPEVADEQELDEGLWRISVQADVPPSMEWLAERYLVDSLKNRLDGDLVTEPTAMALDESAVQRYRRTVLIR
jgi:moderate conductance mechanosensitive channel